MAVLSIWYFNDTKMNKGAKKYCNEQFSSVTQTVISYLQKQHRILRRLLWCSWLNFYCRFRVVGCFFFLSNTQEKFLTSLTGLRWLRFPLCATPTKNFKYDLKMTTKIIVRGLWCWHYFSTNDTSTMPTIDFLSPEECPHLLCTQLTVPGQVDDWVWR